MKLKQIVKLEKRPLGSDDTRIERNGNLNNAGYNLAKTEDGEIEIGLDVEKVETVIDIWIHENNLGNYDKIPKFKEYQKLAKDISEAETIKEKK